MGRNGTRLVAVDDDENTVKSRIFLRTTIVNRVTHTPIIYYQSPSVLTEFSSVGRDGSLNFYYDLGKEILNEWAWTWSFLYTGRLMLQRYSKLCQL